MTRITVKSRVGSDGVLHLQLPLGDGVADQDVQVTVEPVAPQGASTLPTMTARDLLNSDLVGMWADRTDIDESGSFARRQREQAESRRAKT